MTATVKSNGGGSGSRGMFFIKRLFTSTPTPSASTFTLMLLCPALLSAAPQPAVVIIPVADVWSRPLPPGTTGQDDWRETQVLMGEKILIHESSGAWVRIEAIEQPEFTHHNKWEGYPGWVRNESIRTDVFTGRAIPVNQPILKTALETIGTPYLWGGLSIGSGLDCSGLVHLSYRNYRKQIPRDSHEQWLKAKPTKRKALKPADLIFSANIKDPKKVTHVTLYVGDGQLIEAPQTGMVVRKISFQEKYGKPLSQVETGDTVGDRVLYFGSYLK